MSILLSAYFPEGIVFAADKNVTLLYRTAEGPQQDVQVGATTKVIPWARQRAVVGYCGLGQLAGLSMEEWMRQFAAQTREFDDLSAVAKQMRDLIQHDFDRDYPEGSDIDKAHLIVHLGGFRYQEGIAVPSMYLITNVHGMDEDTGQYDKPDRHFSKPNDELLRQATRAGIKHPSAYRPWLAQWCQRREPMWFNNGAGLFAFNVFKGVLWPALDVIRQSERLHLPKTPSLGDRIAYCKMAVDLFDSFFRHHFLPRYRSVGGGADAEVVPWPEVQ